MIVFTQHAEEQMRIRKIDKKEVIDTLNNPDDLLYDVLEKTFVAVKRLNGKYLIVVFSLGAGFVKVVTAFRTDKLSMIGNRIKKGRWVKI